MQKEYCILKINNKCNYICNFCADSLKIKAEEEMELNEILSIIKKEKDEGAIKLLITGGEPTISPHLLPAIKKGKELGFESISLTTNGRKLSEDDFFADVNSYIDVYLISFFSADPYTFDTIAGVKGAFSDVSKALLKISREKKKKLCINCVISRMNYRELNNIVVYLASLEASLIQFSFANIVGFFRDNFDNLFVDYNEILPYAVKAIRLSEYLNYKGLSFENFPICLFSGHLPLKKVMPRISDLHHPAGNKKYYSSGKMHTQKCRECFFLNRCEGIYEEYYRRRGDGVLTSIKKEDFEDEKKANKKEKVKNH